MLRGPSATLSEAYALCLGCLPTMFRPPPSPPSLAPLAAPDAAAAAAAALSLCRSGGGALCASLGDERLFGDGGGLHLHVQQASASDDADQASDCF